MNRLPLSDFLEKDGGVTYTVLRALRLVLPLLILCSCTRQKTAILHSVIHHTSERILREAEKAVEEKFGHDYLRDYELHSVSYRSEPFVEGDSYGHIYVLYKKKGTTKFTELGGKTRRVSFDYVQVMFEQFKHYRAIRFYVSTDGNVKLETLYKKDILSLSRTMKPRSPDR